MPFAAAAITAGAGLVGGYMQSKAVSGAADKANAAQQQALAQTRADLQPWRETGQNALMITGNLAGANGPQAATTAMQDFYTSPGYQFRLDEGMRGVDAAAAARGMLRSGATLKGEQAFAQGLASQEFDNYYNRLYQLSNQGFKAAGGQADAEMKTAGDIAQTDMNAGGAQASIYGNMARTVGNAAGDYFNNRLYDERTQALRGLSQPTAPQPFQPIGGSW